MLAVPKESQRLEVPTFVPPVSSTKAADGRRVQSFDCLRAIACLAVVANHTLLRAIPSGWVAGGYGVSLFCVLSGFLITTILLAEEKHHGKIDLVAFFQRRTLRIAPLYFALLSGFVTISVIFALKRYVSGSGSDQLLVNFTSFMECNVTQLAYMYTFTQNTPCGMLTSPYWSVSIEEQFYLFLPLLFLAIHSRVGRQLALLSTLAWLTLNLSTIAAGPNDFHNAAFIPLVCGSALAFAPASQIVPSRRILWIILLLALAGLGLAMAFKLFPYGLLPSVVFCLIVWLASKCTKSSRLLEPIAFIGRISYCIYLIHTPVLFFANRLLSYGNIQIVSPLVCFSMVSAVSIALATLSWFFFEKRFMGLKSQLRPGLIGLTIGALSPALICVGFILHCASWITRSVLR